MTASLDDRFAEAMGALLGPDFPKDIALAVSGGGDSMAMLTLAHNWTHRWGVRLWVVTVDHGLRPESAAEAEMVRATCAELGHPHATLRWHWDGQGNKMDAARRARLALIDRWRSGINHVLFAHTRDDLAETFLMRLARGAGVDGLSAMMASRLVHPHPDVKTPLPDRDVDWTAPPPDADGSACERPVPRRGFHLIRPCLDMTRFELRHYLRTLKGTWVEDPSNDDPHYDRVRMRQAGAALAELGLTTDRLADTARQMARAGEALRVRASLVWQTIGREERFGDLLFDRDGFENLERDTQMRLLSRALQYVATAEYRPRGAALEALLDRLLGGGGGTLHGCEAHVEPSRLRVFREAKQLEGLRITVGDGGLWDGRWEVTGRDFRGLEIRALGEAGWRQLPKDRPASAPAHLSARSLPAIWEGDRLVACDAMGLGPGGTTSLKPMGKASLSFDSFLLSH